MSGHSAAWPKAQVRLSGGEAHFLLARAEVWCRNVSYAALHFQITKASENMIMTRIRCTALLFCVLTMPRFRVQQEFC